MPSPIATRAYRSKIGRLPFAVRNELCERIRDGATAASLCTWLNKHPAYKATGAARVNAQNITDWRNTGYKDWLFDNQRAHNLRKYAETAHHIATATDGDPAAVGARILTARLLDLFEAAEDGTALELSNAVAKLRKGENDAQKLALDTEKTQLARESLKLEKDKFKRTTCELFIKWHADHKVVSILDDATLDNDHKTEALGHVLFGDLWD